MHPLRRRQEILRALSEQSVMTVREIADVLDVSEATVRRDVQDLADANLVRRVHGGVEVLSEAPHQQLATRAFEVSQAINVDKKRAIARAAVDLIRDRESIVINGGTTTFMMVEFMLDRHATILTNSLAIAEPLMRKSQNRIILPSGELYRKQSIIVSPFDNDGIQNHVASKMFMSCMGLSRLGVLEGDSQLARSEQRLLAQSDELILLADSSKFHQRGSLIVAPLARISKLITDDAIEPQALAMLAEAGVEVMVVPVAHEATTAA